MSEVAVTEPAQSSLKRDRVLASLAAGKSPAEAAIDAGCTRNYVHGIAREQKASVSITVDPQEAAELESALKMDSAASPYVRRAGVDQLEADAPEVPESAESIRRESVAKRNWPIIFERVCRRLRANDERFKNAAQDAYEAADCFLIKARGQDGDVADFALTIWPKIWQDYVKRGVTHNIQLATDSAEQAFLAAKVFLNHGSAPQG